MVKYVSYKINKNLNQYAFVLGHYPELSSLEIFSVLKRLKIKFSVLDYSREILLITTDQVIDKNLLADILGGTIKLVQIIDTVSADKLIDNLAARIGSDKFRNSLIDPQLLKARFGISFYRLNSPINFNEYFKKNGLFLLKKIKKQLESLNIKSGFLLPKEPTLSSVSVAKNKLLTAGFELIFIFNKENCLIGKTLAVQPFADFSLRDFGRPARDSLSGMIPPKLARIMLNIGSLNQETTYLDPFCGSGTFIQEAILLGCQNIFASDKSSKAIDDTRSNVKWLEDRYPLAGINIDINIRDVSELSRQKLTIDLIATEPFLGSPKVKSFSNNQLQKEITILQDLYLAAFRSFAKILVSCGKVVIVLPVFKQKNHFLTLNILKQIMAMGFRQIYLSPQEFIGRKLEFFNTSERGSLLYGREYQAVMREIIMFEKK